MKLTPSALARGLILLKLVK